MLDILGLLLNAYNISVGLLVLVSSVMDLFRFFSFEAVMVDLYVMYVQTLPNDMRKRCSFLTVFLHPFDHLIPFRAAGLMILTLETIGSAKVVEYVPIMKQWLGRGILYIL